MAFPFSNLLRWKTGARAIRYGIATTAQAASIQAGLELSLCLQPALASAIRRTAVVIDWQHQSNRRATVHRAEIKGISEEINER
jgi:hypothetical protein